MSAIDNKYNQLRATGLDLGAPLSPEEPSEAGGRVRKYERGHIYWCSATGAHEVHGGILDLYLAHGGPGANPNTGGRDLGYPAGDEELISGTSIPCSRFEWGAIYWTPGTGGCVLYGSLGGQFARDPSVGLPVTGNLAVAGGQAAYFQRGVMFSAGGAPGVDRVLIGKFTPPPMGCPLVIDPTSAQEWRLSFVEWRDMKRAYYDALTAWRPTVFVDLLQDRLSLAAVDGQHTKVPLAPMQVSEFQSTQFYVLLRAAFDVAPGSSQALKERTLYDLCLNLPNEASYPLSQHCIYAKSDWERFGLLHATDLHISARNDGYRAALASRGLADAAENYSNFQDNARDFIRYANKLHSLGLADAVVATGDLVDYVAEDPEAPKVDNFIRVRRLLLGQPFEVGAPTGEELRLPVFVTRGNHDFRLHPYDLRANIDLPDIPFVGSWDRGHNEHSSHNLTESEALSLQGGKTPVYGVSNAEEGVRALRIDEFDNAYYTFKSEFSPSGSYVVKLGRHRLVLLDTKYDAGLPPEIGLLELAQLGAKKQLGVFENVDYHPATQKLLNGIGPDSVGFSPEELSMFQNAVVEAGADGLVIVAIHTPPFQPHGGEYPYYHRETIHPTADPALTEAYVQRTGIAGTTWPRTGTAHFKEGDLLDGMDAGFLHTGAQRFIEICAGVNLPRPVDLVLYGHHHARVEHRVRFNPTTAQIEYFNDFYTENPANYYATTNLIAHPEIPIGGKIAIRIVEGAPVNAVPTVVRRHGSGDTAPPTVGGRIQLPPYADPLNASENAREWWSRHRPLFAQTAALGPIDERQRFGVFWRVAGGGTFDVKRPTFEGDPPGDIVPSGGSLEAVAGPHRDASFVGFRLVQIADGVISKMRYITLSELRQADFKLPWEPEGRRIRDEIFEDVLGPVVSG